MQNHVNKVARTWFYHIRRLKQARKLLGPDAAANLVASLVFSRLDYCNTVLAGLLRSITAPMQRVQNAAARLVARPRDHVTPTLKDRHWLPIKQRIVFILWTAAYASEVRRTFIFLCWTAQEPGIVCRHHWTNWHTLALLNVISKLFFFNKYTSSRPTQSRQSPCSFFRS